MVPPGVAALHRLPPAVGEPVAAPDVADAEALAGERRRRRPNQRIRTSWTKNWISIWAGEWRHAALSREAPVETILPSFHLTCRLAARHMTAVCTAGTLT